MQEDLMSNIHQIHKQEQLKQEKLDKEEQRLDAASDWLAKLDRGITPEEKKGLKLWLAISPENIAVFLEVTQMWDKMDALSRLSDIFPQATVAKRKIVSWYGALAASMILAITFGLYQGSLHFSPFDQSKKSTVVAIQTNYQTGIGESNTISLPDNSKIVLNTNSFVQVRYSQNARVIELQRGEIHIDVAHDKSRPFSVIAGGKVIQAVGTAFNVEVRSELVELIVTEGKVLVAKAKAALLPSSIDMMPARLPQNSMAISKGEKVDLDLTGHIQEKVTKVDSIDIAASLSWRQGNLIFRGESLSDAMAEISRYTDIEFELADDEKLRQVQVAGMFKTGDVIGLLDALSSNFNIRYEKIGNDKIILSYAG
ncbi:MAG: transmembrane sensor [Alteromonadaceae bacterium]|jgi:transmembrane sensor